MVYYGSYMTEGIVFHSRENKGDLFIIALTKNPDGAVCRVEVDFDSEWYWEFEMIPGAYELVKHTIMDVAFDCDNEDDLLMELDTMFEEVFGEIVIWNEEECNCDCETGCKHCGCN